MKEQLNKMLMDELLTDDQLKFYELTIREFHNPHGTVHRHSTALLLGYRFLKDKVKVIQNAADKVSNILREVHYQIGQEMDINPSAKSVYLARIKYASESLNDVDLPQAIGTTEILNEVKADKGILTEEELKEKERFIEKLWTTGAISKHEEIELLKLVTSNRSTLSHNAELSYNVKKYKTVALKFISEKEVNRLYPYFLQEETK